MKKEIIVLAGIERCKEWDSLNVVPVKMRKKDVGVDRLTLGFLDELLAQVAKAGAAVEDVNLAVDPDFDARGVSAIAEILRLRCGRRSAHAQEPHADTLIAVVAHLASATVVPLTCSTGVPANPAFGLLE